MNQAHSEVEPTKLEKGPEHYNITEYNNSETHDATETGFVDEVFVPTNAFQRWSLQLESLLGMEARGIERVPEEIRPKETTVGNYIQMSLIWFSSNVTANNTLLGLLGPQIFGLGLKDGMILAAFGALAGAAATAYISTFGPSSGCRTLILARFTMGRWPSLLCVALNMVITLGYGLVDLLIAGQILSAINGGNMTIIVGVIVSAIITLIVCLFGIRLFHTWQRYSFIPQVVILFILIGCSGPSWDTSTPTTGSSTVAAANRMSFFFLCSSGCLGWAAAGADFYVYFSPNANRWKVFLSTLAGLGGSTAFTYMVGVGIASGIPNMSSWTAANDISTGALLDEVYSPLGTFGHFCSCLMALGLISNNVPTMYSAALSLQIFIPSLPRMLWTIVAVTISTVLACAGRDKLYDIFESFLALIGYWTAFWVVLTLEEEVIFRRRRGGYDWTAWNDAKRLPIGLAALTAFLIGWVGAILGMYQSYYIGPLGRLVGDGIDLGIPVSSAWAALVFPPLRFLELKYIGR